MDEIYDVYNLKGRKTGKATWKEVHSRGLLHHTNVILVFKNKAKREILLQRRSRKMKQDAGLWQHSAGGHMLAGETPLKGVKRELKEELFVNHKPPKLRIRKVTSFFSNDLPNNNEILHVFEAVYPGPFYYDNEELEQKPKWIRFSKLLEDIKKKPQNYTNCFRNVIKKYLRIKK